MHRTSALLITALIAGCATPPFSGPGGTVDLVSQSPNHVTFAYTHHYASELPHAAQLADAHCRWYGKRSQLVQNSRNGPDRSTVVFTCGQ